MSQFEEDISSSDPARLNVKFKTNIASMDAGPRHSILPNDSEQENIYQSKIMKLEERIELLEAQTFRNHQETNSDEESGGDLAPRRSPSFCDTEEMIVKVNRLTRRQWQQLRRREEKFEAEKHQDTIKKTLDKVRKPETSVKKHVLDIVLDKGDNDAARVPSLSQESLTCGRIRINSHLIISALNDLLNQDLREPSILIHPFKILVDNEEKIRSHLRSMQKSQTDGLQSPEMNMAELKAKIEHFNCLVDVMNTNLKSELKIARQIKNGEVEDVHFSHLWHLFPPGEVIYPLRSDVDELPQAYKVLFVSGGRPKIASQAFTWFLPDELDVRYASKTSPFHLDCMFLDFDGKHFRPVQREITIPYYGGSLPITSLPVCPITFLKSPMREKVVKELQDRGRLFFSLAKREASHKEYIGLTLDPEGREQINSRIIIDFAEAVSAMQVKEKELESIIRLNRPRYHSITLPTDEEKKPRFGLSFYKTSDVRELSEIMKDELPDPSYFDDSQYDRERSDRLTAKYRVLQPPEYEMDEKEVQKGDFILFPGSVYAFVLRKRRYCKCDVRLIRDVTLNEDAFKELVTPGRHKNLIKALIEMHTRGPRPIMLPTAADQITTNKGETVQTAKGSSVEPLREDVLTQWTQEQSTGEGLQDIVRGKGQGLIILLHGAPGTGKTLTAETVAEATRRPLLSVTCGDIGGDPFELEHTLERIFTLAHRWGCVLLLDEADVFLAARDRENFDRNGMVSVFLRVLEYYSGILILTSNREGVIDEAFKSRIHLSLRYPPLSWDTTKAIWKRNILQFEKMRNTKIDRSSLVRFAKMHFLKDQNLRWNGRQIFNAFQTAVAMADQEHAEHPEKYPEPIIRVRHFEKVAEITAEFEQYLQEVHDGRTDSQRLRDYGFRADYWRPQDHEQELILATNRRSYEPTSRNAQQYYPSSSHILPRKFYEKIETDWSSSDEDDSQIKRTTKRQHKGREVHNNQQSLDSRDMDF
ncbi:hypothetical protein CC78DRAFT_575278 [Lojkania enalia]|uniref:AAA+ ATPase domain-containing protein n=1 Tax=Lojkania enalia TaxID=147567 RepID=A0A9P4N9N0_9PLEO|nr:hypothetical protein CC78DRAFT_575278 [Didymosphaeria enalia]